MSAALTWLSARDTDRCAPPTEPQQFVVDTDRSPALESCDTWPVPREYGEFPITDRLPGTIEVPFMLTRYYNQQSGELLPRRMVPETLRSSYLEVCIDVVITGFCDPGWSEVYLATLTSLYCKSSRYNVRLEDLTFLERELIEDMIAAAVKEEEEWI